jgi:formylmethanofuran dehydrogenase subunit B
MNGVGVASLVIEDATCLACGCLCDDIVVEVVDGRIVNARRTCERGRSWFVADRDPGDCPSATIEGRPATTEEALYRAASILNESRAPLVLGLTQAPVETVALAVALADQLGAAMDLMLDEGARSVSRARQRVGEVSATLGEVRDRADVVVFWGADPLETHPRHWERYSVEPAGRFISQGRADRTVLVVDVQPTATSARADRFLEILRDEWHATLVRLRALVRGVELDASQEPVLREWAAILRSARYGAFFYDETLGQGAEGVATVISALTLVRDLNESTRFVALPLGAPGNPTGAQAVLSWQAGASISVDFSMGFPTMIPSQTTGFDRLSTGETDAVLIVGETVEASLTVTARDQLGQVPTIVIAPDATHPERRATVGMAAATTGIDAGGTVARCDGIWLPLRPALTSLWPTDRDWLRGIANRLRTSRA